MNCNATLTVCRTTGGVVVPAEHGWSTNVIPDGMATVRDGDRMKWLDVTTLTCDGEAGTHGRNHWCSDEDEGWYAEWTDDTPGAASHADNTQEADEGYQPDHGPWCCTPTPADVCPVCGDKRYVPGAMLGTFGRTQEPCPTCKGTDDRQEYPYDEPIFSLDDLPEGPALLYRPANERVFYHLNSPSLVGAETEDEGSPKKRAEALRLVEEAGERLRGRIALLDAPQCTCHYADPDDCPIPWHDREADAAQQRSAVTDAEVGHAMSAYMRAYPNDEPRVDEVAMRAALEAAAATRPAPAVTYAEEDAATEALLPLLTSWSAKQRREVARAALEAAAGSNPSYTFKSDDALSRYVTERDDQSPGFADKVAVEAFWNELPDKSRLLMMDSTIDFDKTLLRALKAAAGVLRKPQQQRWTMALTDTEKKIIDALREG